MKITRGRPAIAPQNPSKSTPSFLIPMSNSFLPPDSPHQPYIALSALDAGYLWLPDHEFVDPCPDRTAVHKAPSLAFFLVHPNGTKLVYDLGIRKDWENYPPVFVERVRGGTRRIDVTKDVRDSIIAGGVDPDDVDVVVVSHIHYDHTGNPNQFPNAKYHIGPGSLELIEESVKTEDPEENWYRDELLPNNKACIQQLPPYSSPEWKQVGPFPKTFDYFSDGSFYLVDSTGHLPGHINGLVRIGPNRFVYLASDSCHFTSILSGECAIAVWSDEKGNQKSVHWDLKDTEAHVKRIRELRDKGGKNVEIVLAHELGWDVKYRHRFLPGKFE